MDLYAVLPIALLSMHFFDLLSKRKLLLILWAIIFLAFFLIAGFRECGFDYWPYAKYHYLFQDSNWIKVSKEHGVEIGFALFNHLIKDFRAVIYLLTLVLLFHQFRFIYQTSKYPILSLVFYMGLFFYGSLMGQFRQGLVTGLFLTALYNIENRKRFFFLLAVAFVFHYTAIIGILALFVPRKLGKFNIYILLLAVSFLVPFLASPLIEYISAYFAYLTIKTSFYMEQKGSGIINTAIIIRVFLFFMCYLYREQLRELKNMEFYINIYFLSLIFYISFSFMPALAARGSMYFSFFEIILAANLIYVLRKKIISLFLMIIFVGFSFYRQSQILKDPDAVRVFYPYVNWLLK